MTDFIKEIDTDQGLLVFTFNRIATVQGPIFLTAAVRGSTQIFFRMKEIGGTWEIVSIPTPPDWVLEHEKELGKFLKEQTKTKAK